MIGLTQNFLQTARAPVSYLNVNQSVFNPFNGGAFDIPFDPNLNEIGNAPCNDCYSNAQLNPFSLGSPSYREGDTLDDWYNRKTEGLFGGTFDAILGALKNSTLILVASAFILLGVYLITKRI